MAKSRPTQHESFKQKLLDDMMSILSICRADTGRDAQGSVISHLMSYPHLNENQLAERLNCSVKTLQAARAKGGGIPFIRLGKSVRYRLLDVLSHELENKVASTSKSGAKTE